MKNMTDIKDIKDIPAELKTVLYNLNYLYSAKTHQNSKIDFDVFVSDIDHNKDILYTSNTYRTNIWFNRTNIFKNYSAMKLFQFSDLAFTNEGGKYICIKNRYTNVEFMNNDIMYLQPSAFALFINLVCHK